MMNVVKYDPFRELRSLQDEMTRLFTGVVPANVSREDMLNGSWSPRVDIFENKDHLVLEAELPGMNKDDFELSFENNVLTLSGERKFEKKTEGENYHRVERAYGSFTRSFTLPQTLTAEGAQAEFNNGILSVSLPKREDTKARKIEVIGSAGTPKTIDTDNKAKTAGA
ncbi:MAG: Hsp20/alpha crystallin family protein [Acidobacteria bacterium]|nr:Hsp20/alpha crystallin family protein [Acidobacteriota bacterium]